jgi:hypothetical protein
MLTRFQKIIVGFGEIGDGLVAIITLASYRTNWAFNLTARFEIKNLERKK